MQPEQSQQPVKSDNPEQQVKPEVVSPSGNIRSIWFVGAVALLVICIGVIGMLLTRQQDKPNGAHKTQSNTHKDIQIRTSLVTTGLKAPTGLVASSVKTDTRLFALEQEGLIRIIDANGKLNPTPFLDIRSKVQNSGEMGLLGLAFHPTYQQNGYFYVNYVDKNQNTVVARYKVSSQASVADPTSEKVLLTIKQPYVNHNGGDLLFGKDGYLYISLGDGGSGGDPQNRAQNKGEYLGKILRIGVDKGDPYAIPETNPFAKEAGTKPEIWAYGLRNPWRISFDKQTGDLYIADVGQGDYEEVNVQKASSKGGENYGWRCYEGNHEFNLDGCKDASDYVKPALEYNHEDGRCSITGGYVYRGTKYPELAGKYFYGDYCNGQLFYATLANGVLTPSAAAETPYSISVFGQDNNGEVYFADYATGSIYQIQSTD